MTKHRRISADYLRPSYLTKARLASYWHQVDEVASLDPASVLCVGPGNPFVPRWLQDLGVGVTSIEVIASPVADVRGDVRALPIGEHTVDVALCAQVLEHLPWTDVPGALSELRRVSRLGAVITLPRSRRRASLRVELPKLGARSLAFDLPRRLAGPMVEPAEHHWEIDQPGAELEAVVALLAAAGFRLLRSYRVPELAYHQVFVLVPA